MSIHYATPHRLSAVAGMMLGAMLLPACSMGDDRDRSLMRCERMLAQNAPDEATAQKACTCIVDKLDEEGMSIIAAAGSDRGREIVRQCGRDAGLPVQG